MIRQTASGVDIDVRVVPRAGRSGLGGERDGRLVVRLAAPPVDGVRDGRLLVRLAAPPVDGAANEALIELLATLCERPKRAVRIVSGEKSRSKRVSIDGLTVADARRYLRF